MSSSIHLTYIFLCCFFFNFDSSVSSIWSLDAICRGGHNHRWLLMHQACSLWSKHKTTTQSRLEDEKLSFVCHFLNFPRHCDWHWNRNEDFISVVSLDHPVLSSPFIVKDATSIALACLLDLNQDSSLLYKFQLGRFDMLLQILIKKPINSTMALIHLKTRKWSTLTLK